MKNWDNLRFFLALARNRTAKASATSLGIDEVTIRRRLAMLEADFGTRLFERVDGQYYPTTDGLRLVTAASAAERTIQHAYSTMTGAHQRAVGRVRVGAPDALGSMWLAATLAALQAETDGLVIDLISLLGIADLDRRAVDLAILPARPKTGSYRVRALAPLTLRLYAASSYLDRHPPIRTAKDLSSHSLTGYLEYSEFAESVGLRLAEAGVRMHIGFSSSNIVAQARAAAHGSGIVLLPFYIAEPHLKLMPVLHEEVRLPFQLWLISQANISKLARIQKVVKSVVEMVSSASKADH